MEKIYEVLRVLEGKPVFLREHLERLERSWSHYNLTPMDLSVLERELISLASKRLDPHNMRIEVDVASGAFSLEAVEGRYPTAQMKEEGVKLATFEHQRHNPQVKFIDREIAKKAEEFKAEKDVYSLLYVYQGAVGECERANIFFIRDGILITARDEDVLLGVTRAKVLEIAEDLEIKVVKRSLLERELFTMDAAFMTGTSIHVLGVKEIDGLAFDVNNPVLKALAQEMDKRIFAEEDKEAVWEDKEEKKAKKRLYRSSKDVKVAGVCGGIGEYLDIDPSFIRLLWVFLSLMGGSGIIAYLIAALIIPKRQE